MAKGRKERAARGGGADLGPPERGQHAVAGLEPRAISNHAGTAIGHGRQVRMSIDAIEGITKPMRAAAVRWLNLYDEAIVGARNDPDGDATLGEQRIRSNVPTTTLSDRRLMVMAEYGAAMSLLGPLMGPVVEKIVGLDMTALAASPK